MKTCTKCREAKSLTEFSNYKKTIDGLCRHCKVCMYTNTKQYLLKGDNNAKKAAYQKAWYQVNREEVLQKNREKHKLPAEKVKARQNEAKRRTRMGEEAWKAYRAGIRLRRRPTESAYAKAIRDKLSDTYICSVLNRAVSNKLANIPKELIEVKRLQMLIKRRIKNENSNATT